MGGAEKGLTSGGADYGVEGGEDNLSQGEEAHPGGQGGGSKK